MARTRLLTTLDQDGVDPLIAALRLVAGSMRGAKLMKTEYLGKRMAASDVPPDKIHTFTYVGANQITLKHLANDQIELAAESETGTSVVRMRGVLPTNMSRKDCLDPAIVGAALSMLSDAVDDEPGIADPQIERIALTELATACGAASPVREHNQRSTTLTAPGPVTSASLRGHDVEGRLCLELTPAGRAAILERAGRLLEVERFGSGRNVVWSIGRLTAMASGPVFDDPLELLRYHGMALEFGDSPMRRPRKSRKSTTV